MTSKVFSIFSVYDFVIVCSSVKRSSSSYSLGPETYEIIVSKISSDETFSRNHSFLAIFFHSKLGWGKMNRVKQRRKKSEFIVLKTNLIISVYFYSFKIFDQMQNYSYKLCLNIKAVSLGLDHTKFLISQQVVLCIV